MGNFTVVSKTAFMFNPGTTALNKQRVALEALGFRFYGRTRSVGGEDIWVDDNNDLAFGNSRSGATAYMLHTQPIQKNRAEWFINEPTVAVSQVPAIKVGDVVQVKREGMVARVEGVQGKKALGRVVEVRDVAASKGMGEPVLVVEWCGMYINKQFSGMQAVVGLSDATLILSV